MEEYMIRLGLMVWINQKTFILKIQWCVTNREQEVLSTCMSSIMIQMISMKRMVVLIMIKMITVVHLRAGYSSLSC